MLPGKIEFVGSGLVLSGCIAGVASVCDSGAAGAALLGRATVAELRKLGALGVVTKGTTFVEVSGGFRFPAIVTLFHVCDGQKVDGYVHWS